MGAAACDRSLASSYLARSEDLLARRSKRIVEEVRPQIASRLSISASAYDLIRRQRRKIVPGWLRDKIVCVFIEVAQAELMALEHELEIARQIGLGNGDGQLIAARARASALVDLLDDISSEGEGAIAR
jgi:hypothetical protein